MRELHALSGHVSLSAPLFVRQLGSSSDLSQGVLEQVDMVAQAWKYWLLRRLRLEDYLSPGMGECWTPPWEV